MRIVLHEVDRPTRRRTTLVDRHADSASPAQVGPLTLGENSELVLRFFPPDPSGFEARVFVGDVLIASTVEQDRPDFTIRLADDPTEGGADYFVCSGRLLRDWVGLTTLAAAIEQEGRWQEVLHSEVRVTAGKMQQEAFEALFAELAQHSSAVLLDVYGKTMAGLALEWKPGEVVPVAVFRSLRTALAQLAEAFPQIARQPASRLKVRRVREPVLTEQAVTEQTLEEACTDTGFLARRGGRIVFREQIREEVAASYNLPEHRLFAAFLSFLRVQIQDLRRRISQEISWREERRLFRNHRPEPGARTWWETEDLPRIEEFSRLRSQLDGMDHEAERLSRFEFLPPAPPLREVPASTPLIRSRRPYAAAFHVVTSHFHSYRATLDNAALLARAKSLPVLYEWWCALQVVRCLRANLRQRETDSSSPSPFRRLDDERTRFVLDFAPDQMVDFEDGNGALVRLRYQPNYSADRTKAPSGYGWLGRGAQRTPDLALEIVLSPDPALLVPDLIVVLDAKYSSTSQAEKLDEVRRKYGQVGVFRTGQRLSRQVWALTPALPENTNSEAGSGWEAHCTVDNFSFWSEDFDMSGTVNGAVQAKPLLPLRPPPLELLLCLILRRCGVRLQSP
jgi:hypothetical protein